MLAKLGIAGGATGLSRGKRNRLRSVNTISPDLANANVLLIQMHAPFCAAHGGCLRDYRKTRPGV